MQTVFNYDVQSVGVRINVPGDSYSVNEEGRLLIWLGGVVCGMFNNWDFFVISAR